jgi:hypothetical protein
MAQMTWEFSWDGMREMIEQKKRKFMMNTTQ